MARRDAVQDSDSQPVYARFWLRVVGLLIDDVVLLVPAGTTGACGGFVAGSLLGERASSSLYVATAIVGYFASIAAIWLYFTLMESSRYQGTLGKIAIGIKVTDINGNRISWGKANARFWSKYVSALILYIGFIMAAFTDKRQALHDIIAGTLVLKK